MEQRVKRIFLLRCSGRWLNEFNLKAPKMGTIAPILGPKEIALLHKHNSNAQPA